MAAPVSSFRSILLALSFGALPVMLATACKEDEPRPPLLNGGGGGLGGGGGSTPGAANDAGTLPDGSAGDGGTCTALSNSGVTVDQLAVSGDPQPGAGGLITDGIYELSDARLFVGATGLPGNTGATYQSTMRIAGSAFERITRFIGAGGIATETRSTGTFTIAAAQVTFSLTCPTTTQEIYSFGVVNATVTFSSATTRESLAYVRR